MRKGGKGLKTATPFGPLLCAAALGARDLGDGILWVDPQLNTELSA